MAKPIIRYYLSIGDSLSDPGQMDHRKLFDIIPMDGFSGLKGKSPDGAFTNGYTWITNLGEEITEQELLDNLNKKKSIKNEDDYKRIELDGQDILRYYDEGGATSYNYSGALTTNLKMSDGLVNNLKLVGTRAIVSNLEKKRKLILADDKARGISSQHKAETLVTEWSGANDLITANEKPTEDEVRDAVDARIKNVEKLIEVGYRHFALFNLPDLSLTPHFQRLPDQKDNARIMCELFNNYLKESIEKLNDKYKECTISVFDVSTAFSDAYKKPEEYGLDPQKLKSPYLESDDFKKSKTKGKDDPEADTYTFWDDKHPSARVHKILADKFAEQYAEEYTFSAPHESLVAVFRENYGQRFLDDKNGAFGFFRRSNLNNYLTKELNLETILVHALYQGGKRTRSVIENLGWINAKGELKSNHQDLKVAWAKVKEAAPTTTTGCWC